MPGIHSAVLSATIQMASAIQMRELAYPWSGIGFLTQQAYLCWLQMCALLVCRPQHSACTCAPPLSPGSPAWRAASQRLPHAPAPPALHAAPWRARVSLPAQRPAGLPQPTAGHRSKICSWVFWPALALCVGCNHLHVLHSLCALAGHTLNEDKAIKSESGLETMSRLLTHLWTPRQGLYLVQLVLSSGALLSAT